MNVDAKEPLRLFEETEQRIRACIDCLRQDRDAEGVRLFMDVLASLERLSRDRLSALTGKQQDQLLRRLNGLRDTVAARDLIGVADALEQLLPSVLVWRKAAERNARTR